MSTNQNILSEAPITAIEDDVFNFRYYAKKVNNIVQRNSGNSDSITIGIYGKWGEGKTSFMNLLEGYLSNFDGDENGKRILKYHFNPWRYSTQNEILFDFFDGLSKKLFLEENESLKKAGKFIIKLSRYFKAVKLSAELGIPGIASGKMTLEPNEIFKAMGEDFVGKELSLESLSKKIDEALISSQYKVAIFIDDIDRLDKEEIYMLLKILKLNANFKNLIYIIPLDPEYVAKAIHQRYGQDKEDGYLFLEKIINIPIVLPRIEQEDLQLFFDKKIAQINRSLGLERDSDFKDIVFEFRKFNFRSPREIVRVLNSFFVSAFAIGEEVNLKDLFWLEYLKITDEKCYNILKSYKEEVSIFNATGVIDFNDDVGASEKPNGFRKYLIREFPKAEVLINHLFPSYSGHANNDSIRNNLKVQSSEHYDKYFSYHILRKISEGVIRSLRKSISDRNNEEMFQTINSLFNQSADFKVLYKLEAIIDDLDGNDVVFFADYLISNLSLIPDVGLDMFGRSFRIKLVEKIAIKLNEEKYGYKDICDIVEKLELYKLCYFARKFKSQNIREELNEIILKKTRQFNLNKPFYEDASQEPNNMIMRIWHKRDSNEFNVFLQDTLTKENILVLIRNFPPIWNNSFFGTITKENYDFMDSILDAEIVYNKLLEFYPELIMLDDDEWVWDDWSENTLDENASQFIYWHNRRDQK